MYGNENNRDNHDGETSAIIKGRSKKFGKFQKKLKFKGKKNNKSISQSLLNENISRYGTNDH